MAVSLSRYGRSFATRERGQALANEVLTSEREARLTFDLTDVVIAPSFLQGFLNQLAASAEHITLKGANQQLVPMIERVTSHLGLADQVTIEKTAIPA